MMLICHTTRTESIDGVGPVKTVRDISAPPFRRHRFGAHRFGAGTSRRWDISAPAFRRQTFRRQCKGPVGNWWLLMDVQVSSAGADNNQGRSDGRGGIWGMCTLPKSVQANLLGDEKWRQYGNWTEVLQFDTSPKTFIPSQNEFLVTPLIPALQIRRQLAWHGLSRD